MITPKRIETKAIRAPFLESPNSVHVRGFFTWTNTSLKCSFRSSSDPELSITISALVLFKFRGIWALILLLASSSVVPSLAISRWSWVSGSTHTTIMGLVHLSILTSNNRGTSRTIVLQPFIHSLNTSRRIPDDMKGANNLKDGTGVYESQDIADITKQSAINNLHREDRFMKKSCLPLLIMSSHTILNNYLNGNRTRIW